VAADQQMFLPQNLLLFCRNHWRQSILKDLGFLAAELVQNEALQH
jgi:hypothetical protein